MLNYGPTEIEYITKKDPVMEKLVARYGYIRKGNDLSIYASIVFHIIGQMLSNKVTAILWTRLLNMVGSVTPDKIVQLSIADLKKIGISINKANYIHDFTLKVENNEIDLDSINDLNDSQIISYLTTIRGIGTWTAEMIAEFSLGRLNIFSKRDAALRNGIMKAHNFKTLSDIRFERLRKKYSPYCSVASLYYYEANDDNEFNYQMLKNQE